jgi:hypothetical protein
MSKTLIALLAVLLAAQAAPAQPDLPILRANSTIVDVQDGDRLWKGGWAIDPTLALDVYGASRNLNAKKVTFITDIESLSFDVEPGRTYDFIILLNGTEACRTRISTMAQTYERDGPGPAPGPDTIPITIKHGKPHLQGSINGSQTLDLMFDTGADTNVLFPSGAEKGAQLRFDGTVNNVGTGGATLRQTSSDNRLEIAGLRWVHEPVMFIEKQADAADGIIGYRVFEDKVVEIDYDRMVMLIHDALPAHAAGFVRIAMPFSGSLTAVEATLVNNGASAAGLFILDTGGNGTLMVNEAFVAAHGLSGTMEKLGTSTSRGVGSGTVRSDVVMLPELVLAGFTLPNVPIDLQVSPATSSPSPGGALCMDVLKRFNIILDYRQSETYLKPNTLFATPFKPRVSGPPTLLIAAIAVAAVGSLAGVAFYRTKKRRAA